MVTNNVLQLPAWNTGHKNKKISSARVTLLLFTTVLFLTYMNDWSFPIAFEIHTKTEDTKCSHMITVRKQSCNCSSKKNITSSNSKKTHHGRSFKDGKWYSVRGSTMELHMYSAFYDDRISLGTLPVLRIIAVTDLPRRSQVTCVVFYKDRIKPKSFDSYRNEMGVGAYRHKKLFVEYIFTCELDDELIPDYVTLIQHDEDQVNNNTQYPKIPVEVPQQSSNRLQLGICLSLSYWYHDPNRLVEWLEMQRILGVEKVIVYNNSLAKDASTVFKYYSQQDPDFLELRQSWSFVKDPGELTLHLQMSPVINDCMYRKMYSFHKIMVIDLDEMIVPNEYDKITSMLQFIETLIPVSHPARSYSFRNTYFFRDFPEDESEPQQLTSLRCNKHVEVSEVGYASKGIIDPLACVCMHNHYCWIFTKLYDRQEALVEVAPGFGVNRHYKKCHLENCNEMLQNEPLVDNRMKHFKSKLVNAVNLKFRKLKEFEANING